MKRRNLIGGLALILAIAVAVPAIGLDAGSSVSTKKLNQRVKKLNKRVAALERRAGVPGPQGGLGPAGPPGSPASATVIQGNTNWPLTTLEFVENRFAPSGFTDKSTTGGNYDWQISPDAPMVVRDLVGRLDSPPNSAGGRSINLVNIDELSFLISCLIVGSATICDSGQQEATLPPRTRYAVSVRTGSPPPGPSEGAMWSFRMEEP